MATTELRKKRLPFSSPQSSTRLLGREKFTSFRTVSGSWTVLSLWRRRCWSYFPLMYILYLLFIMPPSLANTSHALKMLTDMETSFHGDLTQLLRNQAELEKQWPQCRGSIEFYCNANEWNCRGYPPALEATARSESLQAQRKIRDPKKKERMRE